MAEEEVVVEVQAVQAVYGDDCVVLQIYPPHLHVHIKPRTADVSSQQFVEAILGIRAGPKYPEEPPLISILDSKGLDEQRQKYLMSSIRDKASELSSYLMLVALCEEAVERLSSMNHPDGDCPLCLYPLVGEDADKNLLPFMKLMSCFHCFHGECITLWWNWLQEQREKDRTQSSMQSSDFATSSLRDAENQQGTHGMIEESMRKCPVCRKVFSAKDIEHVLYLIGTCSSLNSTEADINVEEKLLESDSENIRRQKFEAILKVQQENNGLIEPKRHEVLLPGMFLPRTKTTPDTNSDGKISDQHIALATNSETNTSALSDRPSTSKHNATGRRYRGHNSRKQAKQWIKKDNFSAN